MDILICPEDSPPPSAGSPFLTYTYKDIILKKSTQDDTIVIRYFISQDRYFPMFTYQKEGIRLIDFEGFDHIKV